MENLKALVHKGDLTPYQRALAKREFEGMIERLELLEKAVKNNAVLPLVIGSATKHDKHYFKCDICGKFIGYAEFERDEIKTDYRPETVYEYEKITHVHKHCL